MTKRTEDIEKMISRPAPWHIVETGGRRNTNVYTLADANGDGFAVMPHFGPIPALLIAMRNRIAELEAEKAEKAELVEVVKSVLDVVKESYGVVGWHLNGDVASWEDVGLREEWVSQVFTKHKERP